MSSSRWTTVLALVLALALAFVAFAASAQPPEGGLTFTHKDWQLACDNTGTCRAAGYQAGDADDATGVSVLLTRQAGARQPVTAWLKLANWSEASRAAKLPEGSRLSMSIDGRPLGTVTWVPDSDGLALNAEQTESLLQALVGTGRIVWRAGDNEWTLSNRGATAVLLKMDEFQGRVGTWGALVDFGENDESKVLQPLAAPVVRAAATLDRWVNFNAKQAQQLLRALQASGVDKDRCPLLNEDLGAAELSVQRLNRDKLLVSIVCARGGHNGGSGLWVVNDDASFAPVLVTYGGTEYSAGVIRSDLKGRGVGDCWWHQAWTWDGAAFVPTSVWDSGLCRGIAAGGAWELPTRVTAVVPPQR